MSRQIQIILINFSLIVFVAIGFWSSTGFWETGAYFGFGLFGLLISILNLIASIILYYSKPKRIDSFQAALISGIIFLVMSMIALNQYSFGR
jgi:hypothetical protein